MRASEGCWHGRAAKSAKGSGEKKQRHSVGVVAPSIGGKSAAEDKEERKWTWTAAICGDEGGKREVTM
jgi:hypothetical protein